MDWWINFFRDMDSLEIARSSAWYGEDIELRAGNEPAIFGKEAATAIGPRPSTTSSPSP